MPASVVGIRSTGKKRCSECSTVTGVAVAGHREGRALGRVVRPLRRRLRRRTGRCSRRARRSRPGCITRMRSTWPALGTVMPRISTPRPACAMVIAQAERGRPRARRQDAREVERQADADAQRQLVQRARDQPDAERDAEQRPGSARKSCHARARAAPRPRSRQRRPSSRHGDAGEIAALPGQHRADRHRDRAAAPSAARRWR